MLNTIPGSLATSAFVAVGLFLLVRQVHLRISSSNTLRSVLVLLAALAVASIWAVDINLPLTDSQYRGSSETNVSTVVLLATLVARFAFLIAILSIGSRRLSK
jgi:hypothetical protein